jgi:predicted ester cyclase
MASDNASTIRDLYAAVNAKDLEEVLSYATADAKVRNMAFGATWDFRVDWPGFLDAFPDGSIEVKNLIAQGDLVVGEIFERGTHTGKPLLLPVGEIPATGRRLELPVVEIYRFRDDGKIVEMRSYFDAYSFFKQLGVGAPDVGAEARRATEGSPAAY